MGKVKVLCINWCVEDIDVPDEEEREEILDSLPDEVILDLEKECPNADFDEDKDVIEETINRILSDTYGWLVYGYYYEEVK